MTWNVCIKLVFKEYFMINRFSPKERKHIQEITPKEIVEKVQKLSLKQREQLGTYGIL